MSFPQGVMGSVYIITDVITLWSECRPCSERLFVVGHWAAGQDEVVGLLSPPLKLGTNWSSIEGFVYDRPYSVFTIDVINDFYVFYSGHVSTFF